MLVARFVKMTGCVGWSVLSLESYPEVLNQGQSQRKATLAAVTEGSLNRMLIIVFANRKDISTGYWGQELDRRERDWFTRRLDM
jgi:hypothetical protein